MQIVVEKTAGTVLTVYNIIGVRESLLIPVYSNYVSFFSRNYEHLESTL